MNRGNGIIIFYDTVVKQVHKRGMIDGSLAFSVKNPYTTKFIPFDLEVPSAMIITDFKLIDICGNELDLSADIDKLTLSNFGDYRMCKYTGTTLTTTLTVGLSYIYIKTNTGLEMYSNYIRIE